MTTQTEKTYMPRYVIDAPTFEPYPVVFVVNDDFSVITSDKVTKVGSFANTDHAFKFVQKRQTEHPRAKKWKNCKVIAYPMGACGPVEIVKAVKDREVGTWFY